MKLSNPWIDPRILHINPEAVRAYLLDKGWDCLGPAEVADMLLFDPPNPRDDEPNVVLPLRLEHGDQVQRMIELISAVAVHEDRYAPHVLDDILRQENNLDENGQTLAGAQKDSASHP